MCSILFDMRQTDTMSISLEGRLREWWQWSIWTSEIIRMLLRTTEIDHQLIFALFSRPCFLWYGLLTWMTSISASESKGRLYLAGIWLNSMAFADAVGFLLGAGAACCCCGAALGLALATCFSRLAGSNGCLPACEALSVKWTRTGWVIVCGNAAYHFTALTVPYVLSRSNKLD